MTNNIQTRKEMKMETVALARTSRSYDGRKEFRSDSWHRCKADKVFSQRICPVRRHVVVSYLRNYHDRGMWRVFESSPNDWTVEGSHCVVTCVFALIQGWKEREANREDYAQ